MLNSWRILHGDVRDKLAELPDQSVQCVVTSPPYWGLRDYGEDEQIGLERTPDEYVRALVLVCDQLWRVLRNDGTFWLNLGDSYAAQRGGTAMPAETLAGGDGGFGDRNAHRGRLLDGKQYHRDAAAIGLKHKDLVGVPWRVAFELQSYGWYLRSDIIWSKPNPMPESVTDRPTKAHEYIFLLTKRERYYYDAEAIAEKTLQIQGARPFGGAGNGKQNKDRQDYMYQGDDGSRNKRSVWSVATQPYPEAHFATFPEKLVEPCILAGSKPGDTICDPFCGSGTTGAVAIGLGRNFVGIELNAAYVELARKRIGAVAPLLAREASA